MVGGWAMALALVVGPVAAADSSAASEVRFELRSPPPQGMAGPRQPADLPIELALDDGSAEGDVGVGFPTARQFVWFNSFDRASLGVSHVRLEEIWVLFQPGDNMTVGAPIELVVYLDTDGDPTTGAEVLATQNEAIQVLDGVTFSVYPLATPVVIVDPGDILVGVIPRFVDSGVMTTTMPAAIDSTSPAHRSWLGIWTGDPPDPPLLPADTMGTVDNFVPFDGNWMIRAYGSRVQAVEIPTLSPLGLALMTLGLAVIAVLSLRWRRRRALG